MVTTQYRTWSNALRVSGWLELVGQEAGIGRHQSLASLKNGYQATTLGEYEGAH